MFPEELSEFVDTVDGFGDTALYNGATVVKGIFVNDYVPTAGELVDTESQTPMFSLAAADVPDVAQGDTLQVKGVDYTIASVQPDGTKKDGGWLRLGLFKT